MARRRRRRQPSNGAPLPVALPTRRPSSRRPPTPDVTPQSSDLFLICGIPSATYQRPSPPRSIPLERCCSPHQSGSSSLNRRIRVGSNGPPRPRGRTPLPQGNRCSILDPCRTLCVRSTIWMKVWPM